VDFIRGAARSRGGKPIIAMRSTAKEGTVSRIQPALEQGAGVVTSRGDVHYIVTEHGVADLWGKNIRARALALIEIAHPDHRADLLAAAKARKYVFSDQILARAIHSLEEERRQTLRDGREVLIRPVRISDEETLQDLFYRLSEESVYRRFMAHKSTHPREDMQKLVNLDNEQSIALVACTVGTACEEIVAMARYDVDPATRLGDVAFVVHDDWQNKGLGTILMRRMVEIARARGVAGFSADVLASNKPMMAVFRKSGLAVCSELSDGAYHLVLRFEGASAS
jgi:GNAT superfamily N-acetyltransferase